MRSSPVIRSSIEHEVQARTHRSAGITPIEDDDSTSLWHRDEQRLDDAESRSVDKQERVGDDETHLRLALAASKLRTWQWDFASNEFQWSGREGAEDTASDHEQGARPWDEEVLEEDRAGIQNAMKAAFRGSGDFDHEFRMHTSRGIRWISARATIDRDDAGKPVRMVGVSADVTDRHAVEDDLRSKRKFLDSVVENMPSMVFVKDAEDLRYLGVNRAGEELIGVDREEMIGRDAFDLFPEQAEQFTTQDREALDGKVLVDISAEKVLTLGRGQRILHTRKLPIFDDNGIPRYLLGISEDVTVQQETLLELERARDEANQANLAKSEFLSRMSHELRTPLNSVLGFSQVLAMGDLTTEQREDVGYIAQAGRHLLELINEVLDIARIESGTLNLSLEAVCVVDVVNSTLALLRPKADQLNMQLAAKSDSCGAYVLADHQRLTQVLLNLLSNAVKYNKPGGSVKVICEKSGGTVSITVEDTGIGIGRSDLSRLFTPFERLGAEHTAIEGTGVGLTISRVLTQQMGGSLTVSSTIGVGSRFTIELREAEDPAIASDVDGSVSRVALAPITRSLRLLYVDDNVANMRLVERALRLISGIDLITAVQGRMALDLAVEHQPDLIVLDLHLPDLDGDEVLRRLQADPRTASIPVVMCSADGSPGQVQRLLELGAVSYLTKPVDLAMLFSVIDRVRTGQPIEAFLSGRESP